MHIFVYIYDIYTCVCQQNYRCTQIFIYIYIYTQVKEPLDRCSAREAAWKKTPITIYSYIYRYIYIHIFMNLTSYRHIAATIS